MSPEICPDSEALLSPHGTKTPQRRLTLLALDIFPPITSEAVVQRSSQSLDGRVRSIPGFDLAVVNLQKLLFQSKETVEGRGLHSGAHRDAVWTKV